MRTSFHHQPEAQHPNFQLSTSWQADYHIFWHPADMPTCPLFVRFQGQSGHLMLKNSAGGTCGAQKPHSFLMMRSAKLGAQKGPIFGFA